MGLGKCMKVCRGLLKGKSGSRSRFCGQTPNNSCFQTEIVSVIIHRAPPIVAVRHFALHWVTFIASDISPRKRLAANTSSQGRRLEPTP